MDYRKQELDEALYHDVVLKHYKNMQEYGGESLKKQVRQLYPHIDGLSNEYEGSNCPSCQYEEESRIPEQNGWQGNSQTFDTNKNDYMSKAMTVHLSAYRSCAEQIVNEMVYEGSPIYEEHIDRETLRQMTDRCCGLVKENRNQNRDTFLSTELEQVLSEALIMLELSEFQKNAGTSYRSGMLLMNPLAGYEHM